MKYIILLLTTLTLSSCVNDVDVVHPVIDPAGLLGETEQIDSDSKKIMNGVYRVEEGSAIFGSDVVLKWSGRELSLLSGNEGAYGVLRGGELDTLLYFEGYWRFPFNTSTGLLKLYISPDSGGTSILNQDTTSIIIIEGVYGTANEIPNEKIRLRFSRSLNVSPDKDDFEILAHRGGGRNSDYLGVSENSIPMIAKAQGFGATGLEIDIRMTADGVLFLYHDDDINLRLTQKGPLWGRIENYSWAQIRSLITLSNGEKIPSLREAMAFILDSTGLKTVWLDIKNPAGIPEAVSIQEEYLQKGSTANRNLKIYIGLPEESIINTFKEIPSHTSIPSLCELNTEFVIELNSEIWAPRWTDGLQIETVQQMQSENRKVFVWTLDQPNFIETYIKDGKFDGILSNYPSLVAYHHYINGNVEP